MYNIIINSNRELLGLPQKSANIKIKKYSNFSGSQGYQQLVASYQNLINSTSSCNAMFTGTGLGKETLRDFRDALEKYLKGDPQTATAINEAIELARFGARKIASMKCALVNESTRSQEALAYVNEKFVKLLKYAKADEYISPVEDVYTPPTPSGDGGYTPPPSGVNPNLQVSPQQASFLGNITSSNIMSAIGITLGLAVLTTGIMWIVNKKQRPDVMVK